MSETEITPRRYAEALTALAEQTGISPDDVRRLLAVAHAEGMPLRPDLTAAIAAEVEAPPRAIAADRETVIDGHTYNVVDDRELAVRRVEETVRDLRDKWDAVKVDLDNDALQVAFSKARQMVDHALQKSFDLCTPHGNDCCMECSEDVDGARTAEDAGPVARCPGCGELAPADSRAEHADCAGERLCGVLYSEVGTPTSAVLLGALTAEALTDLLGHYQIRRCPSCTEVAYAAVLGEIGRREVNHAPRF